MSEQPLNNSTEENKSASQSNAGQSKTEVGDIHINGNVGGPFVVGNNNVINLTAKQQVFLSLHQLPQPPADFTGREELIAQLLADFEKGKGATITGQPIHGLVGMGGIGKTALGLVVAHQLKKDYPDAQIFLDLKGTTTPLSATDIMRHVILSFEPGMDLRTLDETGMANTYQSVLHGKRVLLFLDNARSADQIATLRPPETCALLVTSRWTFGVPGLKSRHIGVISQENAEKFLLELCPRIGDQASELAKACAYLPLALRIAGSFLAVNGHWDAPKYIAQLNDRKRRLTTLKQSLTGAELTTEPDLLATFELSYNQLSEEIQKRWRILGVFPTSFNISAVGAMWGLDPEGDEAATVLGSLLRYSLLDYDETFSRYSLHDLLVDFSRMKMENQEEVVAKISHSVYYVRVLADINQMYLRGQENILLGLRLYDTERINFETGQRTSVFYLEETHVAAQACNRYARQGAINGLRLMPKDRIKWLEAGLRAARFLEDKAAEGAHLGNLGNAYYGLGEVRKAIEFHEGCLAIARELGDRRWEGGALGNLGISYANLGKIRKAIEYHEQALAIARETGDRRWEGATLGNLGNAYYGLGEVRKAIEFHKGHLAIARELGDRRGEGNALGNLGNAYHNLGEPRKAIEYHEQALAIASEISDRLGEGNALFNVGLALYDLKEKNRAINLVKSALEIYEAIESPTAEDARNKLKEWGAL